MLLEDQNQILSPQERDELLRFLREDLLSSTQELRFLKKVVIRDAGDCGALSSWSFLPHVEPVGSSRVTALAAVILLNTHYLKTLAELKHTLAHEYGHHSTLSHLMINWGFNFQVDRIPAPYYDLRGLTSDYHRVRYRNLSECKLCDREVIAEDYQILFAPTAQAQTHGMVPPLGMPSADVKTYYSGFSADT